MQPDRQTRRPDPVWLLSVLCLGFFAVGLFGVLNHAMWRDELNPWLIARDTATLSDMLAALHYEGHPVLWYLILRAVQAVTLNPVAMQLLHLGIGTATVWLVVRFAPFRAWQKVLFAFGYLPFYEYLLVSRNYAIGLFLIVLVCVIFETRRRTYLPIAAILVLMANASAFALFVSTGFAIALMFEYVRNVRAGIRPAVPVWNFLLSVILWIGGAALSLYFLVPPADSTLAGGAAGWYLQLDLNRLVLASIRIWSGYIAVLVPSDRGGAELGLLVVASLAMVVVFSTAFRRAPIVLVFYLVTTTIIIAFIYVKFLGGPRHYGHLYIVLVASWWLAQTADAAEIGAAVPAQVQRRASALFTFLLALQSAAGIVAFARDMVVPMSAGRAAAAYIRAQGLDQLPMVGTSDHVMATLAGYLGRRIYYPETGGMGSFVLFTADRRKVDDALALEQTAQFAAAHDGTVLLILNRELKASRSGLHITPVGQFTDRLMSDELFYLYRATAGGSAAPVLPLP